MPTGCCETAGGSNIFVCIRTNNQRFARGLPTLLVNYLSALLWCTQECQVPGRRKNQVLEFKVEKPIRLENDGRSVGASSSPTTCNSTLTPYNHPLRLLRVLLPAPFSTQIFQIREQQTVFPPPSVIQSQYLLDFGLHLHIVEVVL